MQRNWRSVIGEEGGDLTKGRWEGEVEDVYLVLGGVDDVGGGPAAREGVQVTVARFLLNFRFLK